MMFESESHCVCRNTENKLMAGDDGNLDRTELLFQAESFLL